MRRVSDTFYLQLYSTSPAPKRDYHGLTITNECITLNSWDITRGTSVYPRRKKSSLEDFSGDRWFYAEIHQLFGAHVAEYIVRLANGERNMNYLPEQLILCIVRKLAVNDILHLRQTSKLFFEICNTNKIWKIIFEKHNGRSVTPTELKQAEVMSWQYMLRRKILKKLGEKVMYDNFKRGLISKHDKELLAEIKLKNSTVIPIDWKPQPNLELLKEAESLKINIRTYRANSSLDKNDSIETISSTNEILTSSQKVLARYGNNFRAKNQNQVFLKRSRIERK